MTTREFFQTVQNAHISEEMDTAAASFIQKLDEKNAKRKSADSKEKREVAARREQVLAFFNDHRGEAFTRDAIATATGLTDAQVSSAARSISGLVKSEVKVNKAKRTAYTLPVEE